MSAAAHRAFVVIILVSSLCPAFAIAVSAQSTPEPQRYGRDTQGYAGQFLEVLA
jgi:hypothetical protein